MLSRYADDAYARALRRRPDDDVRLEARVGRLHTNSPPATRFAASPALPVSVSARPVSSPALNASPQPSGGESGASGGSGGSEGRCESSMICRTRSTCVSAVVVDPPSSTSSARVRPSLRARSNGRNDPRPSVLATAPASADASVCSRLGRTTPADARVSRPTADGIGAPRRLRHARTAPSGVASPPWREEVAPRRGHGRADAHRASRRASRYAKTFFHLAIAGVRGKKNDSSSPRGSRFRTSFARDPRSAPSSADEGLEERLRRRVRRGP